MWAGVVAFVRLELAERIRNRLFTHLTQMSKNVRASLKETTLVPARWGETLAGLVKKARRELFVSSPYITVEGAELVARHVTSAFRNQGCLTLLTDLSPLSIVQGSIDPAAIELLAESVSAVSVRHLPRLHAKVYICDCSCAIVTSGNLTRGGLWQNYEYGLQVEDVELVARMRGDMSSYAELGASISREALAHYRVVADEVRDAFRLQQRSIRSSVRADFDRKFRAAEDELLHLRIGGESRTGLFEKTITYLLGRFGPMTTVVIHEHVKAMHPDLCDDTIDRVIGGRHHGKQWKHAVRTAQSHLKLAGRIRLAEGRWLLTEPSGQRTSEDGSPARRRGR